MVVERAAVRRVTRAPRAGEPHPDPNYPLESLAQKTPSALEELLPKASR